MIEVVFIQLMISLFPFLYDIGSTNISKKKKKAVQIVPMGKQIHANIKVKMVKKLCFRTLERRKEIQLRGHD